MFLKKYTNLAHNENIRKYAPKPIHNLIMCVGGRWGQTSKHVYSDNSRSQYAITKVVEETNKQKNWNHSLSLFIYFPFSQVSCFIANNPFYDLNLLAIFISILPPSHPITAFTCVLRSLSILKIHAQRFSSVISVTGSRPLAQPFWINSVRWQVAQNYVHASI